MDTAFSTTQPDVGLVGDPMPAQPAQCGVIVGPGPLTAPPFGPSLPGSLGTCRWCAAHHAGSCPRVKAIEFFPAGGIKRVEFHEPRPVGLTSPTNL